MKQEALITIQRPEARDPKFLSPSAAYRWMACPGSHSYEAKFLNTTNIHAIEGTCAHELAAQVLRGHLDIEKCCGGVIKHIDEETTDIDITLEMVEAVREYIETVREIEDRAVERAQVERKLKYGPLVQGTADALISEPFGTLTVVDFKYGAGKFVEVDENEQLLIYAVMAMSSYQDAVDIIEVVIVQPRITHRGDTTRRKIFTRREIEEWAVSFLRPKIREALEKNAPRIPGKHCDFCRGGAVCPERQKEVEEALGCSVESGALMLPDPEVLKPKLAAIMDKIPAIEAWIKRVKSYAYECVIRGKDIPGYGLVEKNTNRKIVPEKADESFDFMVLGIDLRKPKPDFKALGEIEAELKNLKVKPADRQELIDSITERPKGELVLAKLTEKDRPVRVQSKLAALTGENNG